VKVLLWMCSLASRTSEIAPPQRALLASNVQCSMTACQAADSDTKGAARVTYMQTLQIG
jgi:hypothetical protein